MDVQQLEYIVTAVRFQSYARAAKSLTVSPQTISKAVLNIERALGQKLFIRDGRGVRATSFAQAYASRAQRVLDSFSDLQAFGKASLTDKNPEGRVCLALTSSSFRGEVYPANVISSFSKRFPLIEVEILRYPSDTCFEALRHGVADAAIVLGCHKEEDYVSKRINSVDLVITLHRDNPFAQQKYLSLRDLGQMVLAAPEDISCTLSTVVAQFRSHGIPLPPLRQVEPRRRETLDFLRDGGAILSVANNPLLSENESLRALPLVRHQKILLPVYLAFKSDSDNGALAHLRDHLASQAYRATSATGA